MKKVPYTNSTNEYRSVGGVLVPPNGTRWVDPRVLPGYKRGAPQAAPRTHSHPILPLLQAKVETIIAHLPGLSTAAFDALWQGELDGKSRKTLKEALQAEQLRRAQVSEAFDADYDDFLTEHVDLDNEALAQAAATMTEADADQSLLDAVSALIEARKAAETAREA